jgi:hypothetical protein
MLQSILTWQTQLYRFDWGFSCALKQSQTADLGTRFSHQLPDNFGIAWKARV